MTHPPLRHAQMMKTSGLLVLCLFIGACAEENNDKPATSGQAAQDSCENAIQSVIYLEYTAPSEEVVRIEEDISDQMKEDLGDAYGIVEHPGYVKGDPELEDFYAYASETYEPFFSEKGLSEFVQTERPDAFSYHHSNHDYQLKPTHISLEEIEIEDSDAGFGAFNFNFIAEYQTGSEEAAYYDFNGWSICTSEGEITHLTINDLESLNDRIYKDMYD